MIKAVRYKNKSWILQDTEKNTEKGDMFCVLSAPKWIEKCALLLKSDL